jgi:hypothetical protein
MGNWHGLYGGNGGGSGRVAFYSKDDFTGAASKDQKETPPSGVNVPNGTGFEAGALGTFFDGQYPSYYTKDGTVLSIQ